MWGVVAAVGEAKVLRRRGGGWVDPPPRLKGRVVRARGQVLDFDLHVDLVVVQFCTTDVMSK